ncbi:MAG: ABC transporter substrate-binding protein [Thermodesulfobacteriota bacterium]
MLFGKTVRLLVAAALALVMSGQAAHATPVKIDFFFPVPVEGALAKEMTRIVKEYNESQTAVEVTPSYTGSYDETKIKAQAATQAGKPPTVVLMSANFTLDLRIAGDILSLEPMLKKESTTKEKFLADFWPALHSNAIVDGELCAVPYHNSTPLLYYNKAMFKDAGLDPEKAPVTWEELVTAAKKLTRDGDGQIERAGFMMPANYDYLGWIATALTMCNGGEWYNPYYGGEVYYDTPSTLGAVQFIEDLVHKHKVMPPAVNDGGAVTTSFLSGKAAMVIMSTGSLGAVRKAAKEAGLDYGVAFVPRQLRNAVPIGGASLVMFKGTTPEQQEAGWKFINHLTTKENLGAWSRFTGYFAPRISSYDMPEMKAFLKENPDSEVAVRQLPYAQGWFATYQTLAVRKAMEDEIQAVITGQKKAVQAVQEAQAKADEVMRPYVEKTALKLP